MIVKTPISQIVSMPPMPEAKLRTAEMAKAEFEANRPKMMSQEELKEKAERNKERQGRFAWRKLHEYKGCDPQWLDIWQYLIPQRCDCKDGYQKILEDNRPDFTSPKAFFAWGVRLHNAVNAKLGKPEITLDDAYSIWRKDNGLEAESTTS